MIRKANYIIWFINVVTKSILFFQFQTDFGDLDTQFGKVFPRDTKKELFSKFE